MELTPAESNKGVRRMSENKQFLTLAEECVAV